MNVTIEMVGMLIALAAGLLSGAGFLWKMKSDIMEEVTASSAHNAEFRLDFTNKLHESETRMNDKLTNTNTDVTKLEGRVKNIEDK